jgi:CRP/FNR family transcriptional regulator
MTETQDIKYWYLRNHQLFSQMSSEEIKMLCIIGGFRKAKKNEDIYFGLDDDPKVYLLKKGTIKILTLDEEGNEVTKDILLQGDIFGEITLADNTNNRNEFARAASPEVSVCSFKVSDFEKVLRENPMLAIRYTKQVGDKLKAMENRFTDLVFKDVRTRLIEFLRNYAIHNGQKESNAFVTNHFFTQQDIASLIGASRQTVTSLMNELVEKNLLQYTRSVFIIPDVTAFK